MESPEFEKSVRRDLGDMRMMLAGIRASRIIDKPIGTIMWGVAWGLVAHLLLWVLLLLLLIFVPGIASEIAIRIKDASGR